jgi:hypothetical protein
MAVHPLDDGTDIKGVDDVSITGEQERYDFFAHVAQERLRRLRKERNLKLAETDWVVTSSLEAGVAVPAEWVTYRQALRDITDTYVDQFTVVWPNKPA